MKKFNLKLFTAILAVALLASGIIFYACKKDDKDNNSKKVAEFVAKNYDGSCVQVDVFRDENNNARFVINDVDENSEVAIGVWISDALNIEARQTKDGTSLIFDIPNDAIYWLVPLDGYEPIKFEPINNTKAAGSGSIHYTCQCNEWLLNGNPNKCELHTAQTGPPGCAPTNGSSCTMCYTNTTVTRANNLSEIVLVGSTYLIRSNTITLNGTTYE